MQKIFCWHFLKHTLTCNCVVLIVSYVWKNLFLSIVYLWTTVCSISMPFFQTIATFFLWWPLGLLSMSSLIFDIYAWPAFFYPKAFVYNSVAYCLITNLYITLFMVPHSLCEVSTMDAQDLKDSKLVILITWYHTVS